MLITAVATVATGVLKRTGDLEVRGTGANPGIGMEISGVPEGVGSNGRDCKEKKRC